MVIPWVGFPLADLIKRVEPQGSAKYVAFETAYRPEEMPGLQSVFPVLDWPYVEGLRLDEAMHPLTILAVGLYGETLPNQNGAPIRLVVPWKYGFKGIKSIVRISFVDKQPPTSWNQQAPNEYGFYANVNPAVDHPRWSQATERRIGEGGLFVKRRPTLLFNGYAEQVAQPLCGHGPAEALLMAGTSLRKQPAKASRCRRCRRSPSTSSASSRRSGCSMPASPTSSAPIRCATWSRRSACGRCAS